MLILLLNLLLARIFSFIYCSLIAAASRINRSDTDDKSGYSKLSLGAVG